MSTKLGTLTLDLIAKIGNFTGPIKDAEKQATASFTKMREHVNTYGKAVAAGAGVAATALAAMTVQYVNQAAEIQRFATIAQTSTTDFQVMAVGAKQFGVEAEQLADIMKDFNEKIGEFTATGAGGAKDAFEMLVKEQKMTADEAMNLAQKISQVSGDQGLLMYVAALEKAGVSSDEMSFYLESVGSDLTKLAPLLANGGEGFRLWGEAAKKAGIIMDEYAIEKANILKVQMSLLTMQVQGARNQFMQAFIPAIIATGDALTDTTTQTNLAADAGQTLGNVFRGVAAVAVGVYATVKMLSNALAGLAVDAVNTKKLIDGAAEQGGFWSKLPGVKLANNLIFGAAATKATNSGVKMAAADNAKVAADSANAINKIFSNTVNAQTAALAKLQQQQNKAGGNVKFGSTEFNNAMNSDANAAAAKAKADAERAQAELERRLEEQKRLRESLRYDFADGEYKKQLDYEKQIADIRKAGFSSDEQQRFLDTAKARYDTEKELYLTKLAFETSEHRLTEEEKLNFTLALQQKEIDARTDVTDEVKKHFYKAAKEKHQHELSLLRLEQNKRLADAQSYRNTELQNIAIQYEYERQQILLNKNLTGDERTTLVNESYRQQDRDVNEQRRDVELDYRSTVLGQDTSAEDEAARRAEAIQAALDWELITREEYNQRMLENDRLFYSAKAQIGLASAQQTLGGLTDLFGAMLGEQSSAYAAMFAVEKAFAVAKAMMAIPESYSKAYNAVVGIPMVGPYIAPVMGAAAAAAQVAQAAMIQGTNFTGMAHNGIDNIPKEGTWLLDGGERVLNPKQNQDLTRYLEQANTSQQSSQVNVNPNIVLIDERKSMGEYLASREGEQIILKTLKRNGYA